MTSYNVNTISKWPCRISKEEIIKLGLRRTKKRSCRNHMDDILCCRKKNQSHDTNLELNVVQCPKCYSCFSNSLSYGVSCVHGFAHEEQ